MKSMTIPKICKINIDKKYEITLPKSGLFSIEEKMKEEIKYYEITFNNKVPLDNKLYYELSDDSSEHRLKNLYEKCKVIIYEKESKMYLDSKKENIHGLLLIIKANKEKLKDIINIELYEIDILKIIKTNKSSLDIRGIWFSGIKQINIKAEAIFSSDIINNIDFKRNVDFGAEISIIIINKTFGEESVTIGLTNIGGIIFYVNLNDINLYLDYLSKISKLLIEKEK